MIAGIAAADSWRKIADVSIGRVMPEIDPLKLQALRSRLIEAQTDLLMRAADASGLPSSNELRKIADVESAIGAVEALLESKK
jgi:hypothetical protein